MRIAVSFNEVDTQLDAFFIQTNCSFHADFGEVVFVKTDDVYEGSYNVIPRVYE